MNHFNPIIEVEPDGLYTPEVRQWSLKKYKLVGSYCDIFTAGMKNKWGQLVYIDLFAGAGHAQIKESKKIYKSSALIAMSIPNLFSKYILCEKNEECCIALEKRIKNQNRNINYQIINGDSNTNYDEIIKALPKYSKGNTVLSFCFVDPFSLNLNFAIIKSLGQGIVDFLILQALYMDANRNFDLYIEEQNNRISEYLGIPNWREEFDKNGLRNKSDFVKFLSEQYQNQMNKLGYQMDKKMHLIESNEKRLPLYYLTFYSKNKRGVDFFSKVESRIDGQTKLNF